MSGNSIGKEGTRAIGNALLSSSTSKLGAFNCDAFALPMGTTSLDLRNKRIGPVAAIMLAGIIKFNGSLTECNLQSNGLGQEGWTAIFTALRDSKVSKISTWDLHAEEGIQESVEVLAEYISVSASLTECNVCGNELDSESATLLSKAAREKRVMLFGMKHDQTEADFSGQGLGSADAILIASDLSASGSMTECNVLYNDLDIESATMLVEAVKDKDISLSGIKPDQKSADYNGFGHLRLKPPDAILLASDLSKAGATASLTRLDVKHNPLGEKGRAVLRKAVEGRSGFELKL